MNEITIIGICLLILGILINLIVISIFIHRCLHEKQIKKYIYNIEAANTDNIYHEIETNMETHP